MAPNPIGRAMTRTSKVGLNGTSKQMGYQYWTSRPEGRVSELGEGPRHSMAKISLAPSGVERREGTPVAVDLPDGASALPA
eukprot:443413-Alexandrium_andersonii.AAC.1